MQKRSAIALGIAVVLAAAIAVSGAFGGLLTFGTANQSALSAGTAFSISSPSIAGDPGGTSITETVNDMIAGDYRERLVTLTPQGSVQPLIGVNVSGVVNTDNSPTALAGITQSGDALNLLQGYNDGVTAGQPGGNATAGQGGLYVELYACTGTWSSVAGAVSSATDDRDYTCSAGGNGTIIEHYDVPASGQSTTHWSLPPIASATTLLLRTRFTDDGTTDGRQESLGQEQVTLTHNFASAAPFTATQISNGGEHACAIRSDATLWCWGWNAFGQLGLGDTNDRFTPTQVGTGTNWAKVGSGYASTCATKTDGTLWCFGDNSKGQLGDGTTTQRNSPTQVGVVTTWTQLGVGFLHACATRTDGTLWCWGYNGFGQLGDGTTTDRTAPVQVGVATTWSAVGGAVGNHSCATQTNGTLWCWGWNNYGQLGDGTTTNRSVATQIGVATNWNSVSPGELHTCGAQTNGTAWCWGYNGWYQLGDGTNTQRNSPTQVGVGTNWNSISVGGDFDNLRFNPHYSCGTKTDGTLWCWGKAGTVGVGLGNGTTNGSLSVIQIGTATDWASAANGTGAGATCAIKTSGAVWCWGKNMDGRLGLGDSQLRNTPTQVGSTATWSSLSTGSIHGCGLQADNSLWCWGDNGNGQIGIGNTTKTNRVMRVGTNTDWSAVRAGGQHSCARTTGGTLWCWGNNGTGQLGDGTTTSRLTPTQVGVATDWANLSAGFLHTCATKISGTLWCWGLNDVGQLGDGSTTDRSSPTQVGVATDWANVSTSAWGTCATKTGGTMWCWGGNGNGQIGNGTVGGIALAPTQVGVATNWATPSVGQLHVCATRTDGTLWCWGGNSFGQLGLGDITNRTTPVQVGALTTWANVSSGKQVLSPTTAFAGHNDVSSTCATKTDNTMWCWGNNVSAQLGLSDNTQRTSPTQVGSLTTWSSVGLGNSFACGLRTNNTLWCWGDNTLSQLALDIDYSRLYPNALHLGNFGRIGGAA